MLDGMKRISPYIFTAKLIMVFYLTDGLNFTEEILTKTDCLYTVVLDRTAQLNIIRNIKR